MWTTEQLSARHAGAGPCQGGAGRICQRDRLGWRDHLAKFCQTGYIADYEHNEHFVA